MVMLQVPDVSEAAGIVAEQNVSSALGSAAPDADTLRPPSEAVSVHEPSSTTTEETSAPANSPLLASKLHVVSSGVTATRPSLAVAVGAAAGESCGPLSADELAASDADVETADDELAATEVRSDSSEGEEDAGAAELGLADEFSELATAKNMPPTITAAETATAASVTPRRDPADIVSTIT